MELLETEFSGPHEIQYTDLPEKLAIYIISHSTDDQEFQPILIGTAGNFKNRFKQLMIHSSVPKKTLGSKRTKLYYHIPEEQDIKKLKKLEEELISIYQPEYRESTYSEFKDYDRYYTSDYIKSIISDLLKNETLEETNQNVEKTKRFSSIVGLVTSSLTVAIAVVYIVGLFNSQRPTSETESHTIELDSILTLHQNNLQTIERLTAQYHALSREIDTLSKLPAEAKWKIEISKVESRLSSIETVQSMILKSIGENPEKALSVPLMRKDIEHLREIFENEINTTRDSVDRIYDQNKWFIGLLIPLAVSVLGMSASSFLGRKK